jgi:methyl-accepting chemotaxis protein
LNLAALKIVKKTREEVIGQYCGDVWDVDICKDERCGIECMKRKKGSKSVFQVGDETFTTHASYIKDRNGKEIGHIEVVANITKPEYSEKALNKLAEDTIKLSEGNFQVDFEIANPGANTKDEYQKFKRISNSLKKIRQRIEK